VRKIRVGIIGATGYGGVGLIELLIGHPFASIGGLMAKHDIGKPISEIYPHLKGFCDLTVFDPTDANCPEDFDVVFFATPDGVGQKEARKWLRRGVKVIDYSGDFRFSEIKSYTAYAARIGRSEAHADPNALALAVYGLPELHREAIANTDLVGNPGCFAASCILGLVPALKTGLIRTRGIIIDAKSGISGAGKTPKPAFHFPARHEAVNAYKIAGHQHVCEIERELTNAAGEAITITFTPHVVPVSRGIVSTIYADLIPQIGIEQLRDAYEAQYKTEHFIRVFSRMSC